MLRIYFCYSAAPYLKKERAIGYLTHGE